jgi:leucyl aminopeptidase
MKISELLPKSFLSIKSVAEQLPDSSILEFSFPDNVDFIDKSFKKLGSIVYFPQGKKNFRIYVSLGDKTKATSDSFRKAAASFSRWCISHPVESVNLDMNQPSVLLDMAYVRAILEGLCLGGFEFKRYLSRNVMERVPTSVLVKRHLAFPGLDKEIERSIILGESVDLARDWIHEPANKINPQVLEERVKTAAKEFGLSCKVIQYDELVSMGAGGITAVGRGSVVKPRLILVEYNGAGKSSPITLIGKAITFDTGGYSLKGTEFIQGMKYDKAGGISVLAAIIAAARLTMKVNLVAIIPAAENMISGDSYRPDDILSLLSGLNVEIVSTDAEGRLILFDAIAYAQIEYMPKAIIDIATLTGGVKIALGTQRAGLLSNSDSLAEIIYNAGETTGEKVWRLPMDDEYFELLKSEDADMKNSGPREAQTIVGAIFLKQAVTDDIPWAHLDIAATGETDADKPWCAKGANGFGIRLMLETVEKLTH